MEIVENKQVILDVNFTEEEKNKINEALALVDDLITKCNKYGDYILMNDEVETDYNVDNLIRASATICTFMGDVQNCTFRIE